jgi:type I restriction enzyme S subunit
MKPPAIDASPGAWEIVRDLLRRHVPGREVWAFGSRVKGTAKPYSDLDLAILGDEPLPLATMADLTDDFTESDLPFKVDLVDWATTGERFRTVIEGERVVVQAASPASVQCNTKRPLHGC